MKQQRKDLLGILTACYKLKNNKTMCDYVFITERGRVRQLCHKRGIKFPELDREAKNLAARAV